MLCIGHRGARGYAPENTLESIEIALNQGAKWIEIDIRQHSGELVVIHDKYLERTTNGHGHIYQHDLSQLRAFQSSNLQGIPLLSEVIEQVNRRAVINIELKDRASALPTIKLIEYFIERGWHYDDFLVSSFYHHALRDIKLAQPLIKTGALCASVMIDYAKFAQDLGAWSINLCSESVNQEIIDDAHQRGLKVLIYTVNDPRLFSEFEAMGADGVFTDYPQRFFEWKGSFQK